MAISDSSIPNGVETHSKPQDSSGAELNGGLNDFTEQSCNGKFVGWRVEFKNDDGIWKPANIVHLPKGVPGVQRSHHTKEIHKVARVFSKEAALAFAWAIKANDFIGSRPVRIVPYHAKYSVTWKRDDAAVVI